MKRSVWVLFSACLFLIIGAGCGGHSNSSPGLTGDGEITATRGVALAEVVADIEAAPVPDGVDAGVFDLLREQLIRDLTARNASKVASTPPLGEDNVVGDLKLYGDDVSGFSLGWTYVNKGDYNLDGLVNVSDLTPVGQHYEADLNGSNWAVARRADGNADGRVTVNDITPIGQNYLTFLESYNIYGGAAEDGPWSLIGTLDLPAAPTDQAFSLAYDVPGGGYWFYQLRPVDGDGTEGEPSQVSRLTVDPPLVELGEDTIHAVEIIGPLGGGMETTLGDPSEWISIWMEEGAVEEDTSFEVGTNDGSFEPVLGQFKDPIVTIKTGGVRDFLKPVHITVPIDREDTTSKVLVPYLVDDDGRLELIDLVGWSYDKSEATFETWQLKGHLIWVTQEINWDFPWEYLRSLAFTPDRDGLQVVNTGSMWHPGGECFGMTSFSNWYYNTQLATEGDLFPRFMYEVPVNGGTSGQRIICTRAHTSIVKRWQTYWDTFVGPQGALNDAQRFASITNGLENAGHPVLVDLRHENGAGGAHSILAYAYQADGFYAYDPNAPGVERFIHYDSGTGSFDVYSGYDSIRYSGSGALWLDEPYLSILNDAKHEFAENGFCTISITSHGSGQEVPAGFVTLTGTIESTVELVDELWISAGGDMFTIPIAADGNFSQQIQVYTGNNIIYFSTWATRTDSTEVFIPHDLGGGAFTLTGV